MDALSLPETLVGIVTKEYEEYRLALLQHLVNKIADYDWSTSTDYLDVVRTLLSLLTIIPSRDDELKRQIDATLCCLNNLTGSEDLVAKFFEVIDGDAQLREKLHFSINSFLSYNPQLEDDSVDPKSADWAVLDEWQHMGGLLCNLAATEPGRQILLQQSSGYMQKLILQIRSRNPTRRKSAVGSIRSCLFDTEVHWWMLYEMRVLTPLLVPLVVNTAFTEKEREGMDPILWMKADDPDQKPEEDLEIMKMLVECIILLCQKRGLREELRKRKVYPVLKNLDLKVEDEGVTGAIYEVVSFLMGDEDPSTPIETYQEYMDRRQSRQQDK